MTPGCENPYHDHLSFDLLLAFVSTVLFFGLLVEPQFGRLIPSFYYVHALVL